MQAGPISPAPDRRIPYLRVEHVCWTAPGKHVDPATAGSVTGHVAFAGKPPAPAVIKMASDPACTQGAGPNPVSDAVLVDAAGDVENVFVYIKDGAVYRVKGPDEADEPIRVEGK